MNAQKAEYWLSNFAANTPADCRTRTEEAGIALLPELVKLRQSRAEVSEQTHRIATLTAERDALQAKLDTILNYINSEETNEATGFWLKMLLGYEQAAAQEQPND